MPTLDLLGNHVVDLIVVDGPDGLLLVNIVLLVLSFLILQNNIAA